MALLYCYSPLASLPSPSPSLSPSSPLSVSAIPFSRVLIKPISLLPISTLVVSKRSTCTLLTVRAASNAIDGAGEADSGGPPPQETKEAVVAVDKLPLESKLQEKMDQKLKMKMAKKIRLRRKRLLRKRKMRKKGRWPPSKMKKLKNV